MKLKIVKSEHLDDWYLIERAEHDGREWLEKTKYGYALRTSARFSDADVEGHDYEMRAIAKAIRDKSCIAFRRCSVAVNGDAVHFCSPRNSQVDGVVTYAEALDLADQIDAMLGKEQ